MWVKLKPADTSARFVYQTEDPCLVDLKVYIILSKSKRNRIFFFLLGVIQRTKT